MEALMNPGQPLPHASLHGPSGQLKPPLRPGPRRWCYKMVIVTPWDYVFLYVGGMLIHVEFCVISIWLKNEIVQNTPYGNFTSHVFLWNSCFLKYETIGVCLSKSLISTTEATFINRDHLTENDDIQMPWCLILHQQMLHAKKSQPAGSSSHLFAHWGRWERTWDTNGNSNRVQTLVMTTFDDGWNETVQSFIQWIYTVTPDMV